MASVAAAPQAAAGALAGVEGLQGGVGLAHPEDLEEWLCRLGLTDRLREALQWCDEQGATFLEEVAEHVSDLAAYLELSPEEASRVSAESRAALFAVHPPAAAIGNLGSPQRSRSGNSTAAAAAETNGGGVLAEAPSAFGDGGGGGDGAGGIGQSLRALSVQDPAVGSPSGFCYASEGSACGAGAGAGGPAASGLGRRTFSITAGVKEPPVVLRAQSGVVTHGGIPEAEEAEHNSVDGGSRAGSKTLARTATFMCHGPCSGVFGSMQVGGGTLEIAALARKDAHRYIDSARDDDKDAQTPATKQAHQDAVAGLAAAVGSAPPKKPSRRQPIRRCDTIGIESAQGKSREHLVEVVHEDGLRPVSLNAGQTGTVYALEVSGEKIAVFKPREGEHFSRKSVPAGEGHLREEAVYLADRLCDSRAGVPVTSRASIEVDGRTLEGSVQAFVSDVIGFIEDYAMPRDAERASEFVSQESAEALALLDMRVLNTDRHSGNLLLLRQHKPHGLGPIDHGCCLPPWWLLGEANFDAWLEWPQLRQEPGQATRQLANTAYERLPKVCEMTRGVGLSSAAIVTLQLCTLFVKVAVGELAMPVGAAAELMCRDPEMGFAELSWLEAKVQNAAIAAGSACRLGENERGDQELKVDDEGEGLDVEAFLKHLEEALRAEVQDAAAERARARMDFE